MKGVAALLCLDYAASVYAAGSEGGRPRGVGPEFAKFYKDPNTFTCISNPSLTLPLSRLNDDYCDCPDGSDEPGTAACAHLSPLSPHTPVESAGAKGANTTLALPGFYCKNKGHIPAYVPFTSVNDGVCDHQVCCDGSEEWQGVGGVKCADRCGEIGKEWRKADEARQKSLGAAAKKRRELVVEAQRLRRELEDKVSSLGKEIEGSEVQVKQLEGELAEVERRERGKVVRGGEAKAGGKLGVLVGLAKQRSEELREALTRVRGERDSGKSRLVELEQILSTFKEEYNPNFNDEGVKRAVRAWEDYAARDKGPESDAAHDRDLDNIVKSDKDNGLDWEEYESEEGSDTDVLYAFENYLPPTMRTWLDTQLRTLRITLIDAGILASSPASSSSGDTKPITDAKNRLTAAQKSLDSQRKSLADTTTDLASDRGADDIFRALKGHCISTDAGEYTYELCFLEKTTQKPKKGGGNTNMGNFVRLDSVEVDEEVGADGRGLGQGKRVAMRHEGGQHCWNGPNRQTTVVLGCAERDEIWRIVEEEKCVYRMEVGTPAVCEGGGAGVRKEGEGRDEL